MAKSASAKPRVFRRAHLWVALLISLLLGAAVAVFTNSSTHGRAIELKVSDSFRALASLPDTDQPGDPCPVTVIAIDDAAIQTFGHWPWPWTNLADIIDLLHELGARLVVLDIEFPEEDAPRVVDDAGPDGKPTERIVRTVPRLVESIRKAGNVIVPFSLYVEDLPSGATAAPTDKKQEAAAGGESVEAVAPESCVAVRDVLLPHALSVRGDSSERLLAAEKFQPMIAPLGEACAGSGYTTFRHDREDSVVRRVPLLMRGSGKVFPQEQIFPHLMLEAAGMWQFGRGYRVGFQDDRLFLASADGRDSISIPVDGMAQLELRWPRSLTGLGQVSVMPFLLSGPESRRRYRSIMARLNELWPDEGWAAQRRALDEALARTAAAPQDEQTAKEVGELRARLASDEEHLTMNLLAAVAENREGQGADEKSRRACALAAQNLEFITRYFEWTQAGQPAADRLAPLVKDRLCILGRYATGVSDFHATPIGSNQPGVTVYPAGIRTILSGVAFRHLPRSAEWALTILAAALVAVTVHLSTWRGVGAALGVSAVFIAAAALAASREAVLLPVAGPALAVVGAFAGVSVYRQLTEASSRRWITRVFEQYTSPEHVTEILRQPERLGLGGERRDITVLFSDIAGFTPLSERLAPEPLVALLNRYLSAMTEVLLAERATLDKYEGDGIIAFFGAPVPAPDHALRAVRAGVAMHAALPRVNEELIALGLLPEGTRLAMRVGCSTGPAIVGNFGSEQRFDYTAMGDTVNLGGRLEEANRWLGSRLLVPEATRAACGRAILFRRFGPALIRGKAKPVDLYEPLAPEPAPADLRALADAFGRAIDALAARNVDAADAALREALAACPDDGPSQVLKDRIAAIREGRAAAGEPWNLARSK